MDWADEKAREWLPSRIISTPNTETFRREAKSLAALLRGVEQDAYVIRDNVYRREAMEHKKRADTLLAEVRRVVQAVQDQAKKDWGGGGDRWAEVKLYTDEIISRLEKL